MLDAAHAGTFWMDAASGALRWSPSLRALTGVSPKDAPASLDGLLERVHRDDRDGLREAIERTARDGGTAQAEVRLLSADGAAHWYDARWRLVVEEGRGTIVGIVRDIDGERAVREQTRFLADVSEALDASLDMDRTLAGVAELCVRHIADWCSIDTADASQAVRNVAVAHVDPTKVGRLRVLQERYPHDPSAERGAASVIRTGRPELYGQIPDEVLEGWVRDDEHLGLVRSLDIGSAIVVPLTARGRVLGSITLVRGRGRPPFGEADVAFAAQVAARAALAVDNARLYGEARAQERASDEARALLDALVAAAPIGIGFLDTDFRYVSVNDALAELDGIPAIDHLGRTVGEVLPSVAEAVEAALKRVVATGEAVVEVSLTGETPREPGRTRHYVANCYPVALDGGERLGVGMTVVDVTERVEAADALREQRDLYEALMRAQSELGQAFVLLDGERMVYVNEAAERLTGRSAQELLAMPSLLEILPPEVRRNVAGRIAGARAGREPAEPFRTEVLLPGGGRVPIEAAGRPLEGEPDGRLVIIARDITERVAQERELQRVLEVEQSARRASEAAHARVRLLADASALLERSLGSDEPLQQLAELLVARVADACALDVVAVDGHLRRAGADARAPDGRERLLALAGDPRVAGVLAAGQTSFADDASDSVLGRSAVLVPLVARGRPVGVLSLGWRDAGRRPTRDEWTLIEALGQRIALAVDGALQYRERAHVAQTLQASLLPAALPHVPSATVAAEYLAAGEGIEVGGDFYDLFALDDGSWALVIGDVLGKGAEAAAVTALTRYTLRALAARTPSPAEALATLNAELLRQMPEPRFVTAVLGRLAPRPDGGARLVVACAGHPPPIVLRADGSAAALACSGTLLGVEHEASSTDLEVDLGPGDALVLYTDGVTEAGRERPLSPEDLAAALAGTGTQEAGGLAREVVRLAERRAAGALRDDLAVLVVVLESG